MAARIESTVLISRPVEDVFAYVLEYENNFSEWARDVKSVQKVSDGPVAAGTVFKQRQEMMGKERETELCFTAIEPNERIDAEVDLGMAAPTMSLHFDAVDGNTRVTAKGELNPKGVFKLLAPMGRRQGQKMWDARLASLKSVLDAS